VNPIKVLVTDLRLNNHVDRQSWWQADPGYLGKLSNACIARKQVVLDGIQHVAGRPPYEWFHFGCAC